MVTFWGVFGLINEEQCFYIKTMTSFLHFLITIKKRKMNELKAIEIAQKFCNYLHWERTGSRTEFAELLGISPQWVTAYRRKLEKVYKVQINFSRKHNSYLVANNDYHKLPPPLVVDI